MKGMEYVRSVNDHEILKGLHEGATNSSVAMIYRYYSDPVRAYIVGIGGSLDDASDVLQETIIMFVSLVQAGKFRQQSSIKTFLISIAKNIWSNVYKSRESSKAREKLYYADVTLVYSPAEELTQQWERQRQMLALLDSMGSSCREILKLFYLEDRRYDEIAKLLNLNNEQVARNKKCKCMKALSEKIAENPHFRQVLRNF